MRFANGVFFFCGLPQQLSRKTTHQNSASPRCVKLQACMAQSRDPTESHITFPITRDYRSIFLETGYIVGRRKMNSRTYLPWIPTRVIRQGHWPDTSMKHNNHYLIWHW